MTKSKAANEIKKLKQDMRASVEDGRKAAHSIKRLKRISSEYRDKIQDVVDMYNGQFESAY